MIRNLIALLIFFAVPHPYTGFFEIMGTSEEYRYEDLMPALAAAESSNRVWATSFKGAAYGRGLWQVSEIAYEQFRWHNPNHWAVKMRLGPDCLYNSNVCYDVALYYLKWLDNYYRNYRHRLPYVLSGYNQGPSGTARYGINHNYVRLVMAGVKK